MIPMKFNRFLLLFACIGIALYFGIAAVSGGATEETGQEKPSISKQDAANAAAAFLQTRYKLDQPKTFVVYQSKKTLSGFLQKEHLNDAYKKQYGAQFPIDYYQVEVLNPLTKQRYYVDINFLNAAILGWTSSSSTVGGSTGQQKAIELAKQELSQRGLSPDQFTLISKPQDGGHLLFEKNTDPIGASKLRAMVDIDQNQVIGFRTLFSIPEEHTIWLEQQDTSASVMTWISLGFTFLMSIAAMVYAVRYRKEINFGRGVLFTVIYAVIYITNNINMYPAFKSMAGTADNGVGTLVALLFMNLVSLLLALSLYVSLVAGNRMWQRTGWHPWPAWKEERFGVEVFYGMGRGYLICLFILGVQQTLFYAAEQNFDMWAVNDPSDSPLNMLQPGLFPLLAWVAAISEEATFRLFGIILFKKLVRSNFLAVLLPSIIWAASHTQYPVYPVYTRLIEVTVLGIIFGYAFLKFGLITAIFAHACMDSILMGLSLFSLNNVGLSMLGGLYILLPAIIGYLLAWLHGKRRRSTNPVELPPHLEAL
jgi:hypothetical protein